MVTLKQLERPVFQAVPESENEFLQLFPHRFDYIWAPHPAPGEAVAWKTESRHPLSDRLITQGSYLYGVRFGAETNYCLLDIDCTSSYHPQQDPFAISRLLAALEVIGLVRSVVCTSSMSGGLHLYFPLPQAQKSWQLAIAVATVLENAGYFLKPGQLELFPDPKPYCAGGAIPQFNAHRLPLQLGFYLLNSDFQPIWSTQQSFVQHWRLAQQQNAVNATDLQRVIKQAKRTQYRVSGKADKFLNDLNAEIEQGWTGFGQTNRLLGRIAMRTYIFEHLVTGGEPLTGQKLVAAIVKTARSLPGFAEFCRHQHELEQRAVEWADCIERSHYFPYGTASGKFKALATTPASRTEHDQEHAPTWNQQQSTAARSRIQAAIADLLETGTLPSSATERFQRLTSYGIGGGSLYRHRDLWHPANLVPEPDAQPVENPPDPPTLNSDIEGDADWQSPSMSLTSLFAESGRNVPVDLGFAAIVPPKTAIAGSNSLETLSQRRVAAQAAQIARMQQFWQSDDPILMAEALRWSQMHPDSLCLSLSIDDAPGLKARDCSDLLAEIAAQTHRLRLSQSEVGDQLWQLLGQRQQALLGDAELLRWLEWLEAQATPTG